ncbi:NAC domain-containing protein 83-like [Senna tora]|uniref:NAC domain-containing protein 83-like n=1 Tax=Senna tora TaxID=362788 RepID=A0A834WMQ8_9FABA|nr:NAC domain-containing protein 83-like [Senna tora]
MLCTPETPRSGPELVIHYLKRKVLSHPLPASVILDFDVFHTHPSSLPGVGDSKEKRYFFSHRNGNASKRDVDGCGGYWKTVGKDTFLYSVPRLAHQIGSRCDGGGDGSGGGGGGGGRWRR